MNSSSKMEFYKNSSVVQKSCKTKLKCILRKTLEDLCADDWNKHISTSAEFTNLIGKYLIRMGFDMNWDIIPEYFDNDTRKKIDFAFFDKTHPDSPLIVLEHEQGSGSDFKEKPKDSTGLEAAVNRLILVTNELYKVVIWWQDTSIQDIDKLKSVRKSVKERIDKIEKYLIKHNESLEKWLIIIGIAKFSSEKAGEYMPVDKDDFEFSA